MARFSLAGHEEDDDERIRFKRRRTFPSSPTSSGDVDRVSQPDEDREEEEDDDYKESEGEEEDDDDEEDAFVYDSSLIPGASLSAVDVNREGEEAPSSHATNGDKFISLFLTDPDVLDCCICFEPLTIPVFQCENGHIACSSCCAKISNKCPSCSWPIGYNRCRAIEKVLESIRIACQNKEYGCKETVTYSKKKDHEKACMYLPCSCPLVNCNFVSSSKLLYQHFSIQHMESAVRFDYNCNFTVTLKVSDKALVLQERKDKVLFILNNNIKVLGNMVSVSCIWPCSYKGFLYDLVAKTEGNSLRLQSFTKCTQGQVEVDATPSTGFLLIPCDFFLSDEQLKLDIRIQRHGTFSESFIDFA